ncbi:hypothetical protein H9P43_006882 [Blastocladiella emersonii ATCC 22665]|nr:hypothetical protein H9P43_006882 [Blastocladiella emersonii ATCC 22665]
MTSHDDDDDDEQSEDGYDTDDNASDSYAAGYSRPTYTNRRGYGSDDSDASYPSCAQSSDDDDDSDSEPTWDLLGPSVPGTNYPVAGLLPVPSGWVPHPPPPAAARAKAAVEVPQIIELGDLTPEAWSAINNPFYSGPKLR